MTPKQTALRKVALFISSGFLSGIIINALFSYFSLYEIGFGLAIVVLAYMIHFLYAIELEKAETLELLNKSRKE